MDESGTHKLHANHTVDRLRQLILDDTFPFGEPLKQAEIAEMLGVSRTPVREALKTLAQEGLVDISPTGRTSVAGIDPRLIQENYEIRCQLEMWMLELSIPVISEKDLEKASRINDQMETCSQDEWNALNFEFHSVLYRPANKPHTLALVENIYTSAMSRLRKPIYKLRNVQRSIRDHRELLAACAARDVQAAKDRLESHILLNSLALIERVRAIQERD